MTDDIRPWKLVSSAIALDEKWFRVRKDIVELPSGKRVDDYFLWESPHLAGIVPVTAEGKFVMVEQYRHAVGRNLLQFPSGAVNKNETPEVAARRELEEEAGYLCDTVIPLGRFAPYGSKITGTYDFFIGLGAKLGGNKHHDDQEETRVLERTSDEIWQLLKSGGLLAMDMTAAFGLAIKYLEKHPFA